jgi:hypothetical protein
MPIECLYPPQSVIPEYLKASVIHLPFSLASEPDSPLTVNKRHTWTETERKKAMKAPVASSLHDLGNLVSYLFVNNLLLF